MSLADWGWTAEIDSGVEGFPSVPVFRLFSRDLERLHTLLLDAEEGEGDWELFEDALEESAEAWEQAFEQMRAAFLEQRFYKLEGRIEEVATRLEEFWSAVEGEELDCAQLSAGGQALLESLEELHWSHLATGAGGVSSAVNVFRQLAQYGDEAALHPEMWSVAGERCLDFYGRALAELEQSPKVSEPAVAARRAALVKVVEAVKSLMDDPHDWDDALRRLSAGLLELSDVLAASSDDKRSTPTDYLWLNQAYHVFSGLRTGTAEEGLARESLSLLLARIEAEQVD